MLRYIKGKYLIIFAMLAVIFMLPLWLDFYLHVLILMCLNVVLAMGLALIFKMGAISFGHSAYVGIGAYTSVLLVTKLGVPFWLAFFAAGAVSALFALFFARITLGLRRIYFAITTFAFTELLKGLYTHFADFFGGPGGITNIPFPEGIETYAQFYYLAIVFMLISFFIFYRLSQSFFGLLCDGLSLSELLQEHVGIDTRRLRIVAFVIACTSAGFTGSILAHYLGHISSHSFTTVMSIEIIVYCAVGGLGSIPGAMVGATVLTLLGDLLYGLGAYKTLAFGGIVIATVLLFPRGIVSLPWRKALKLVPKRKAVGGVGSS